MVWKNWLADLEFLATVPTDRLRLHVGFGYYLGAPIERDIWDTSEYQKTGCEPPKRDSRLTEGVESRYWLSESDPSRERFSIKSPADHPHWINADTLRTQVDISNLVLLNVLNQTGLQYVEVGGGYGQLAHAILSIDKSATYTIIDFPQVLQIVRRWMQYVMTDVDVISGNDLGSIPPGPGQLRLVDCGKIQKDIKGDILINCNSFFEMRTAQVQLYLNTDVIATDFIYSNNRDIQEDNKELKIPVSKLLSDESKQIWPPLSFYRDLEHQAKSGRIKKVLFANRTNNQWAADLLPSDLKGILGEYMPSH